LQTINNNILQLLMRSCAPDYCCQQTTNQFVVLKVHCKLKVKTSLGTSIPTADGEQQSKESPDFLSRELLSKSSAEQPSNERLFMF